MLSLCLIFKWVESFVKILFVLMVYFSRIRVATSFSSTSI